MADAYRHNLNAESGTSDEPRIEVVGGGRLRRKAGCSCKPPGFWSCIWHGIETHDVWECTHGAKWRRYQSIWCDPIRPREDDHEQEEEEVEDDVDDDDE